MEAEEAAPKVQLQDMPRQVRTLYQKISHADAAAVPRPTARRERYPIKQGEALHLLQVVHPCALWDLGSWKQVPSMPMCRKRDRGALSKAPRCGEGGIFALGRQFYVIEN